MNEPDTQNIETAPLLPEAEPRVVLNACAYTLEGMLEHMYIPPQLIEPVRSLSRIMVSMAELSSGDEQREYMGRAVRTVMGICDLYLFNNMALSSQQLLGFISYGRSEVLSDRKRLGLPLVATMELDLPFPAFVHYLTSDELHARMFKIEQYRGFMHIETLEDLRMALDHPELGTLIYTGRIDSSNVGEFLNILKAHATPDTSLLAPLTLSEDVHAIMTYGAMNAHMHTFLSPRSSLPVEDIAASFLLAGIPLFSDTAAELPASSPVSAEQANHALESFWQAAIALWPEGMALHTTSVQYRDYVFSDGSFNFDLFAQHVDVLLHNFGPEMEYAGERYVQGLLVRSGIAAVTLALDAIFSYCAHHGTERHIWYDDFFYYEIWPEIYRTGKRETDLNQANVFMIAVAPSIPYDISPIPGYGTYAEFRDHVIQQSLARAIASPGEDIFLIIDNTTDPTFTNFFGDAVVPPNLHVFVAASLTKHRNGDQNHFEGSLIVSTPDRDLMRSMIRQIPFADATITPFGIYSHIPKTREQLSLELSHMKKVNMAARAGFDEVIAQIPPRYRWQYIADPYAPQFFFLAPPIEAFIAEFKAQTGRSSIFTANSRKRGRVSNFPLKRFSQLLGKNSPTPVDIGISRGDSFGLDQTRFGYVTPEYVDKTEPGGNGNFSIWCPRISFGRHMTPEEARAMGRKIAEWCVARYRQGITS